MLDKLPIKFSKGRTSRLFVLDSVRLSVLKAKVNDPRGL